MKKIRILAGALAVCMAGSITACSGSGASSAAGGNAPAAGESSQASGGANEVIFWHAMGGVNGEQTDLMVKNFNESQSAVHVTAQFQGTYDDELTKLKTSMQSNSGPDVCQVYDIGTKFMVDSGYIAPVGDFIKEGDSFSLEDIEPNCVNYYSLDGKLQSMPFNSSTPMLYYNKDAFKEAGLDPEKPPKTFAELKEYAGKLTKKDGDKVTQYGFSMAIYGWFFEQLIAGQGQFYADNENGRSGAATKVSFDENGAGLNVVTAWKDLLDSGVAGNFGRKTDDTQNAFIAGRTAMIFESTAIVGKLNKGIGGRFEFGTGYLPKVTDSADGGVVIGGGSLWIIDNKNDAKKANAWEFVKYSASQEAQSNWSKGTGYFAVNKTAYDTDDMKAYLEENPNFKTAIDQLHESPTNTYTQGALLGVFPEARKAFEENMENVISGKQSPEECIANAAKTVNSALDNYNATTKQ